jgi:hypothetical protein
MKIASALQRAKSLDCSRPSRKKHSDPGDEIHQAILRRAPSRTLDQRRLGDALAHQPVHGAAQPLDLPAAALAVEDPHESDQGSEQEQDMSEMTKFGEDLIQAMSERWLSLRARTLRECRCMRLTSAPLI